MGEDTESQPENQRKMREEGGREGSGKGKKETKVKNEKSRSEPEVES